MQANQQLYDAIFMNILNISSFSVENMAVIRI